MAKTTQSQTKQSATTPTPSQSAHEQTTPKSTTQSQKSPKTNITQTKSKQADIGLIGLAVMGENLILNMERNGATVAVFNRTIEKVDEFLAGRAKGKNIIGAKSLEEFIGALKSPRKVFLMVKAGAPVDEMITQLIPLLNAGDLIIDGGNSNYQDTARRVNLVESKELKYIGTGVSGGEEGALNGPAIMPGGTNGAYELVKDLFEKISAKASDKAKTPCCAWMGTGGAGHYVKMVHNGIEYGDMQLICEAYQILKEIAGLSNEELCKTFSEWNKGPLESYLIEITRDIFTKKDDSDSSKYVVDIILDAAGQKGTGKWTGISSLDLGIPLTLISEAVYARALSAHFAERQIASKILSGPIQQNEKNATKAKLTENEKKELIAAVHDALYGAKIISYAQGFSLLRAAAQENKWQLDFGTIAAIWRAGCIIRSRFLNNITDAFKKNPTLANLLIDPYFAKIMSSSQEKLRKVICKAVESGIPTPSLSAALSYYDGYRCARLPANLLQAQRDFFGAHMYERVDKPRGEFFHTNWTGKGGTTASSVYKA